MSVTARPPAPGRTGDVRLWLGLIGAGALWGLLYWLNERLWSVLLGDWLGLDLAGRAGESLTFFLYDTAKIMLLLVGLIFVVGMLRTALSPERVRDVLAGRGLVVGLVRAVSVALVGPRWATAAVFLVLLVVLAFRPQGLFGRPTGVGRPA